MRVYFICQNRLEITQDSGENLGESEKMLSAEKKSYYNCEQGIFQNSFITFTVWE